MHKSLFMAILLICSINGFSCDKKQLSPTEALKEADIVFRGVVDNLRYLDDPDKIKTEPRIIVTFKVSSVWKGEAQKIITIHTTHNKDSCNGFVFKDGEEYLVYSRYNRRPDNFINKLFSPKNPTLGVKVYGGTKLITKADEDLKMLGNGSRK